MSQRDLVKISISMSFHSSIRLLLTRRIVLSGCSSQRFHQCSQLLYKNSFLRVGFSWQPINVCSPYFPALQHARGYAKSKDKKKGDGKGKKKIQINEDELAQVIDVENMRNQMQKSLDVLRDEFVKNLSLRSTTGSIETLRVKLDGQDLTLQELAQVVRKNPKTIVINMSTFPQAIPAVLQAIQQVTREHRENLARNAKALFVKCRDAVKDVQNKFLRNVKKKSDVSEDLSHDVQSQVITIADQYVEQADKMLHSKQSELLGKE
ncbi:hypothetical protein B566_EDAN003004 [Ephemera danica]|nr:hypothetical protein B566_EDAN003004 [Ephemera danica]